MTLDRYPKAYTSIDSIIAAVELWRSSGYRIVFTNGCFDLLHIGHTTYLYDAKALGDLLIVGINSDSSVKRLKGDSRPIKDENTRLAIMSSLDMVDGAVLFDEDTPYNLIKQISPDILVKGGDWAVEDIVGSDLVIEAGGQVLSLPYHDGHSTTDLVARIQHK